MIFFIILVLLILNPNITAYQVIESCKLWLFTLVPIMYPTFICIDMIASSKFIKYVSNLLYPVFKKIFNIHSPYSTYIILLSIICGAPASSKLIQASLNNNLISKKEAENLIYCFSYLSLPFMIHIVNNTIILINFYLIILIAQIIIMHIFNKDTEYKYKESNNDNKMIPTFITAIKKNIETMLNILGIIMFFKIIINILHLNTSIIYSYLEILGGLNKTNPIIFYSSIVFLGISIHLQIISIYPKLNYLKFILFKLFTIFLILIWFFFNNIN